MHRRRPVLLAAAACALLAAAPAHAAPVVENSFTVSGMPGEIAAGPDGNVWVTLSGSSDSKELARTPPAGTVKEFDSPSGQAITDLAPGPSAAGGPVNRLWGAYNGGVLE